MKKLIYQFYEIEVPDDFPDGFDRKNVKDYLRSLKRYADEHPDVADRIIREYETAYWKWVKSEEGGPCASGASVSVNKSMS